LKSKATPGLPNESSQEQPEVDALALDELLGGSAREREESWRYSKHAVRALTQQDFAFANSAMELSAETLLRLDLACTRGRRVVIVNGGYSERYSDVSKLRPETQVRQNSATALAINIAGANNDPLHLVYVNVPSETPSRWQSSVEIEITGNAELIEQHIGESGADVLGALTTRITLSENAKLQTVCFSDLADSVSLLRTERAWVGEHASFGATHAHFGGRLQRIESIINLEGKNATCRSRGVFALRGRQHTDIHLDLHHNARDTKCDVFWRGVADQRSRGVFHGAITVAAGADGADAKLSNKNLLLSPLAEIDTQPVLEIYADEVKAAHGATVGQLDERALFYLRSRGVSAASARAMLIAGFCREVFDDIRFDDIRFDGIGRSESKLTELREHLEALLSDRLPFANEITA
jgi:Fe-S cluster assembly protein SufD